ncbi:MAG: portal protein [Anaerolineaceae bacterium]|nr:portal protein [Anaerolineaceae bacterium]
MRQATDQDLALYSYSNGRLMGLRVNRYSWWVHWRELADYFLPRRYKWLITPNQMARGAPINQHILDSSGCIFALRLAAGLVSGKSGPTSPWLRLKVGKIDSTKTSPLSLWLAECERLIYLIFAESNFYNSIATFYLDLVVFGTASMLIYEDFKSVINCINPCLGEYYVDIDGKYRPCIFYREFTMTVDACVKEFGEDNVSESILALYNQTDGAGRTRELIIAHSIEPNDDGNAVKFGFPKNALWREAYWEWGGSTSTQGGANTQPGFLRKKFYFERINITGRWDLVSNDAYGRSPAMDALPDQKQVQLETRRKAQAIDKMVNPPLVADVQLKNQPANLTPGGITYVQGFASAGKPGFASVYETKFPVQEITQDLEMVKARMSQTFFNDVLRVASQYETRSNVTAVEWDLRKSEALVMLGPVLERIDNEVLKPIVERVFAIANRAGIIPPPPAEAQGMMMNIEFQGILLQAQQATQAASIERVLQMGAQLAGIDPSSMDNIDIDYAIEKTSSLLNNDPKMIRSEDALAKIRQQRAQQAQQAQQADIAQKLSQGAKNLSGADMGGGQNALQQVLGGQGQ